VDAYDNAANHSTQSSTISITTPEESLMLDLQISGSTDDAEEREDGIMNLNSSDLELVDEYLGNQTVGLRFNNITIPQGMQVTNATITFVTDSTNSSATNLIIRAEDSDNAPPFTNDVQNVSSRNKVRSSVSWSNIEEWDTVGVQHTTPDIRILVQDVVSRSGWLSGNSICFIITGTGTRTATSREGDPLLAPVLHLEYRLIPFEQTNRNAFLPAIQLLLQQK
jgi:hypothetical protein